MKTFPLFLCTFHLTLLASAEPPKISGSPPAPALSLAAVTRAVLADNPTVKEARAKWAALRARVPQAAAWEDLRISGKVRAGRFVEVARDSFTDQALTVEQMIPLSGRNKSRERIAAAEALAALEDTRRKELDVLAKARAAYFRLAADYALLELNRADASSLHQALESSRAKFEVGAQTQAEVLTAENEVTRLEENRRDLERDLSAEETQLKVLMHREAFAPLGRPAGAPPSADVPPAERLRSLIYGQRPEIRAADAALAAARARLELARREWIPDPALSVEAQRYNGAAQAASEVSVGVSFNVPWLNREKYRAEEREAARGVEAAQYAQDAARTEALGLLRDQLQKIATAHHHRELFRDRLIPTARQALDASRTGYETGQSGLADFLTAQRSLRELEVMARRHQTDHEAALAELEAIVGTSLQLFSPRTTKP